MENQVTMFLYEFNSLKKILLNHFGLGNETEGIWNSN